MTLAQLDRTVFELIRLKIVELGYLPDWRAMTGTLEQKRLTYEAAKNAIKAGGNELIQVFGVGAAYERGTLDYNVITINRRNIIPSITGGFDSASSPIGGHGTTYYEEYDDGGEVKFHKKAYQERLMSMVYEIRSVTKLTSYERICFQAIYDALGVKRALPVYTDDYVLTGETVGGELENYADVSSLDDTREMIWIHNLIDVQMGTDQIITTGIVPINTISYDTYALKRDDPAVATDTDDPNKVNIEVT